MINPKEARFFYHKTRTNADGSPQKWRRNGQTTTLKKLPGGYLIPVKRGLKEYGYITEDNIHEFNFE